MDRPLLAFAVVMGVLAEIMLFAFLVGLLVFEVERMVRLRRARRRRGYVDVTAARP